MYAVISLVFTWQNLLALVAGGYSGIVVGILPGIGPAVGMALAFPIVMHWNPMTGLIFMASLFRTATYGGSVSAILLNTPGTAANAATVLDAFPMTQKGQSAVALGISATGAFVGGSVGILVLMFFSPVLADFALAFGPAEYLMVAVFAFSVIASVVKGDTIKGLISAGIGLACSTVGFDVITGHLRFTFGAEILEDGIPFIQALVGLFAISQALTLSESTLALSKVGRLTGSFLEGFKTYFKYPATIIRSTIWGVWIGILPAVGQSTASLVAYADAMRCSKNPETFGTGNPQAVVATETANDACMPGELVCTLALGIPGGVGAAIFMGVMIAYGVIPGPLVFTERADLINGLFLTLILCQFFIIFNGFTLVRYMAYVSLIPNEIIVPAVISVSLLGSYAVRNMMGDVILTVAFGFLGYIMKKTGFNLVPFILGMVLGQMMETNFHRALMIAGGSYKVFFESSICKTLVVLTLLSLGAPYFRGLLRGVFSLRRREA